MKKFIIYIIVLSILIIPFAGVKFSMAVDYDSAFLLRNITINGDFKIDTDSDGEANNWDVGGGASIKLLNNRYYQCNNGNNLSDTQFFYQQLNIKSNHKYYISFYYINTSNTSSLHIRNWNESSGYLNVINGIGNGFYSTIITTNFVNNGLLVFYLQGLKTDLTYYGVSNILLIDLTETFGAGNEPTLVAFEQEYLTQVDGEYFNEANNIFNGPGAENVSSSVQRDVLINSLNFDTSVLGYFGSNLDIDIWGVFLDDYAKPPEEYPIYMYTYYMGKSYIKNATYYGNKFRFDFTSVEKDRLKKVLFDRRDVDYITLVFPPDFTLNRGYLYLQIDNSFLINVTINSLYLGMYENRYTVGNYNIIKNANYDLRKNKNLVDTSPYPVGFEFRFYDNSNLLQGRISAGWGTDNDNSKNIETGLINLPLKFTNVNRYEIDRSYFHTGSGSSEDTYVMMQFYEIGVFSSTNIVNPSYSSNITIGKYKKPTYKTVAWYDFFGHIENGFNYIVYDNIVSHTIQDIFGYFSIFFNITKSSVELLAGISIIGLILGLSIILFLIKKAGS